MKSKLILVVNGPNLNLLSRRENNIYGEASLDDINCDLVLIAEKYNYEIKTYFSNHEGDIIDFIQQNAGKACGLIINPGAYTHSSIAIRDAIVATEVNTIEVHLSNIYRREKFRCESYFHDISIAVIFGFGKKSYELALLGLIDLCYS